MQEKEEHTARRAWEGAIAPLLGSADGALWRAHCDALYRSLVTSWLGDVPRSRVLKTDLFDEAVGDGLFGLLAGRAGMVAGIDVAANVALAARSRHASLAAVQTDVRRLPFGDGKFNLVISNSTLDHFKAKAQIDLALAEIYRVLAPDGMLLVTLDNPANPAVALRNALPLDWLLRSGVVPYPVGATYGRHGLARGLARVGFEVLRTGALLHCPRAIAVALAARAQRRASPLGRRRFLRRLMHWEWLSRMPTRYLTGYFVAMLARKP